jgi:hypothetical protein
MTRCADENFSDRVLDAMKVGSRRDHWPVGFNVYRSGAVMGLNTGEPCFRGREQLTFALLR